MYGEPFRDVIRRIATIIGIVIAVVLAVGGLVMVATYVVIIIGFSNYGSNK